LEAVYTHNNTGSDFRASNQSSDGAFRKSKTPAGCDASSLAHDDGDSSEQFILSQGRIRGRHGVAPGYNPRISRLTGLGDHAMRKEAAVAAE